jgi:hypothetical protein
MRYIILILFLFASIANALECRLIEVIDGDTIKCEFDDLPYYIGKEMSVRFRDYNASEIRTTDKAEKARGIEQKKLLSRKLENAERITLSNISRGKYFRLVADVYADDKPVVESTIAYSEPTYKCGTKRTCSQMSSCAEAYFFLNKCGLTRLDRDKDGVPCESICNR